jgi:hypothetical protein
MTISMALSATEHRTALFTSVSAVSTVVIGMSTVVTGPLLHLPCSSSASGPASYSLRSASMITEL